jgi:hypothetical protein
MLMLKKITPLLRKYSRSAMDKSCENDTRFPLKLPLINFLPGRCPGVIPPRETSEAGH